MTTDAVVYRLKPMCACACAGLQLHVPAGGQAVHMCAALFLMPGLYKLHAHPMVARPAHDQADSATPSKGVSVIVNPLYISVS